MDLKSVAVVVFQSKGLTGGGKVSERGGGQRERVSERVGQREGWRLFFFSIDLSPDSHWLLLNKRTLRGSGLILQNWKDRID